MKLSKIIRTLYFTKGITTIEVIIVLGIFVSIIYLTSASFINFQTSTLLNDNAWKVATILQSAQQNASSGQALEDEQFKFGVLFDNSSLMEFRTLTDFSSRDSQFDLKTELPSSLQFSSINLPDSCLSANDCVIFSSIQAVPSNSGFVKLKLLSKNQEKTISINQEGKVSF